MTSIERRELQQQDKSARVRTVVRDKIRYRDGAGRAHSETKRRLVDAERRRAEIELELSSGTWHDPRRGEVRLSVWAGEWLLTRHDLRPTTHARPATTLSRQVLPRFGATPLLKISNGAVRAWVADMVASGLSPATVRKAVFALRQCLAAAPSDRRLALNPAVDVPLPGGALQAASVPRSVPGRASRGEDALSVRRPGSGRRLWRTAVGRGGRAHQGQHRRPPVADHRGVHGHRGGRQGHAGPGAEDAAVQAHDPRSPLGDATSRAAPGGSRRLRA
jgi:hypothetical protein